MEDGDEDGGITEKARLRPSMIKNKEKRSIMTEKLRKEKKLEKKKRLKERQRKEEKAIEIGEEPPPKKIPRTIENTRELDETVIQADDEELHADDAQDEFNSHFTGDTAPKVLITTCHNPSKLMHRFIAELLTVIPGAVFYERGDYHVKQIVKYASNREFTSMIVINENHKRPNGLLLIHLPDGPTAHFKLSSLVLSKRIKGHGTPTRHQPELILNNFSTRLGHRVGRLLASVFPQNPQFRGRRVVTFHNQRDFIFFRHHRYIFEARETKGPKPKSKARESGGAKVAKEKPKEVIARLQECGPRFTLKLQSLQRGTFDSKEGEYEWVPKADMDTSRRRFFL